VFQILICWDTCTAQCGVLVGAITDRPFAENHSRIVVPGCGRFAEPTLLPLPHHAAQKAFCLRSATVAILADSKYCGSRHAENRPHPFCSLHPPALGAAERIGCSQTSPYKVVPLLARISNFDMWGVMEKTATATHRTSVIPRFSTKKT
jgi:hypothetical protein